MLTLFEVALPKESVYSVLINRLFKKYRKGFYVHLPKESRIANKKKIAKYVARYVRHPAVTNARLYQYDGKTVTFWYGDHDCRRHFVTMTVREFIKALIQHIPDRNSKIMWYCGTYSRRTKRRYFESSESCLKQATFEDFLKNPNKWVPTCPNCGEKMTFVYYEKDHQRKTKFLDENYLIGIIRCLTRATTDLHP